MLPIGILGKIHNTGVDTGKTINNSGAFASESTAYLTRTPGTATSTQKFTMACWFKLTDSSDHFAFFDSYNDGVNFVMFYFDSAQTLQFYTIQGGVDYNAQFNDIKLRDTGSWYHVVLNVDTTQGAGANRVQIFLNGVKLEGQTNAQGLIPQNYNFDIGNASFPHSVGRRTDNGLYLDGYLADYHFMDGSIYTETDFGYFNEIGVWVPKDATYTYANNGFYLDFSNGGDLGNDVSGNNNDFTNSNVSQSDDTPTNNQMIFNDLTSYGQSTLANAGRETATLAFNSGSAYGTIFTTGFYFEFSINDPAQGGSGLVRSDVLDKSNVTPTQDGFIQIGQNGSVIVNGSTVGTFSTFVANDIIGIWLSNSGDLFYSVNGTTANSGSAVDTGIIGDWSAFASRFSSGGDPSPVKIFVSESELTYAIPAGYKTLLSSNLPDSEVNDGSNYFAPALYTGNASTQSITGVGFQPDLVWTKGRTTATFNNHLLHDSTRGATKFIQSNSVAVETTAATALTSFDADGFSIGSFDDLNTNAVDYVAWCFKKKAGFFDIVGYTGNATNRTIAHSLTVIPEMMIMKNLDNTNSWQVYHKDLTTSTGYKLELDTTSAELTTNVWNSTDPTTSVFSLGTSGAINGNADDYVNYLFASVEGFSKVGSYTGNGNTDGPFVYTGFLPAFLLIKRTDVDTSSYWIVYDSSREAHNPIDSPLLANLNSVEQTGIYGVDLLSNGFKIRVTNNNHNASGGNFIYLAIAENPFKYSNAR